MRAGERPITWWCDECKEEHTATVLGGISHGPKVTALIKQKLCIGCGNPTTGSIGRAGYYWPNVCQTCKNDADEELNHSVKSVNYLLNKVFA